MRIPRSQFIGFTFLYIIISIIIVIIALNILSVWNIVIWYLFTAVWLLYNVIPRFHDIDKNSINVLWLLMPAINISYLIYLSVAPGTDGDNKYGKDPLAGIKEVINKQSEKQKELDRIAAEKERIRKETIRQAEEKAKHIRMIRSKYPLYGTWLCVTRGGKGDQLVFSEEKVTAQAIGYEATTLPYITVDDELVLIGGEMGTLRAVFTIKEEVLSLKSISQSLPGVLFPDKRQYKRI